MRASADGKEWVVYKRYAQGTAAMLELRRLPRTLVRGRAKRVRRDAAPALVRVRVRVRVGLGLG